MRRAILFTVLLAACGTPSEAPPDAAPAPAPAPADAAAPTDAASSATDAAPPDAAPPAPDALPGKTEGCPDGMVLVEGNYCPAVAQRCVEHHDEYEKDQKRKS